jgi:hypothetical protein
MRWAVSILGGNLTPIKILKETAKFITVFDGYKRTAHKSKYALYNSFEEAKEAAVSASRRSIAIAEHRVEMKKEALIAIMNLTEDKTV